MTPSIPLPRITAQSLSALAELARQIETTAPFIYLLPGQLQAQGGSLFPGSEMVVYLVAQILMRQPHLFPGCNEDGRDLMNSHEAVNPLRALMIRLQGLCDAARDTLVALQAANLRRALLVLSLVKQQDQAVVDQAQVRHLPPSKDELHRILVRQTALVRVYRVIDQYYDGLKRKKAQSKAERQAAQRAEQHVAQKAARRAAELAANGAVGWQPSGAAALPGAAAGADAIPDPVAAPDVPDAPPPISSAQRRAETERKDAIQLRAMEQFEDELRALDPSTPRPSAPRNEPPHAFSAQGMRRYAVRRGDRSALKPPPRPDTSASARAQRRATTEFMAFLAAQRAQSVAVPHPLRE